MLRIRIRFANRFAVIAGLLGVIAGAAALLPGCSEPLTLYHVPGAETMLANGGKVLILPFMDTRTEIGKDDRGDIGYYTRDIFVEALREFRADQVVELMAPKLPRRTRSLTNAQVAELGRQYGADLVVAGQVFSFAGTRAASIPPRAGLFLRIINAHDGSLLFVGDHYRSAGVPGAEGGRDLQALYVSARLIEGFLKKLQPALIASNNSAVAPLGALAMLPTQPEKKGLLSRMFKPGQNTRTPKRKLFAWRRSSSAGTGMELGNLYSRELQTPDNDGQPGNRGYQALAGARKAGKDGRSKHDNGGNGGKKKREPGNVPETERYLGMTASFLFSPDQWDDQFVPEVPPLIDFDENFYQLPAPPVGATPEPLPVPPSFTDEFGGDAVGSASRGIRAKSSASAGGGIEGRDRGVDRGVGALQSGEDSARKTTLKFPTISEHDVPVISEVIPGNAVIEALFNEGSGGDFENDADSVPRPEPVVRSGGEQVESADADLAVTGGDAARVDHSGSNAPGNMSGNAPEPAQAGVRAQAPDAATLQKTSQEASLKTAQNEQLNKPSVEKRPAPLENVVVDHASAQVIDELPEIDMRKVYPNIIPADAPYPAPALAAKLSGDELAADLFEGAGEPWQDSTARMAAQGARGAPGTADFLDPSMSEGTASFYNPAAQPFQPRPSDAIVIPHSVTTTDVGQPGQGGIGMGSFQLDPDTLEVIAINLPPATPDAALTRQMVPVPAVSFPGNMVPAVPYEQMMRQAPRVEPYVNVPHAESYVEPYIEQTTPEMPYVGLMTPALPYAGKVTPAIPYTGQAARLSGKTPLAPEVVSLPEFRLSFGAADAAGNAPGDGVESAVVSGVFGNVRPRASETAAVMVPSSRKSRPSARTAPKPKTSAIEAEVAAYATTPFIADNSGSASTARAKPMAKRPAGGRRSGVKGEMVARRGVAAREAQNAVMQGPLLGGRIVSEQPRTFRTIEAELSADPYAVMQDSTALVAMPGTSSDGIRILMLPFHERDNPNNLIYNHGGGEVVTTLFGIQLASDPGINLMWDATGRATHQRLLSREEAIEMGRQAGADFVIRGQVVEFRRAQSVPSFYSVIISTAVLAAQLFFAEMSGVDVATEMYRVADGMCVMSRRDRSQQKYVVQTEKTIRRMARNMMADTEKVLRAPAKGAMDPLIDVLAPVSILSDPDR